ncbi:predicted protein [Thalassiosira pseudonana CCMP1335]|jgi:hypothetical protein|uniref:Uncharacterized protein n=1 Tax=Thalassiosira pseudonana TaxID=35128 RepID=B8C9I4_THAPS|nr:predicted protein [Thalassiosira pseudonana CCMP1335]EED89864.1 predicted protein [Thalassiosira pseudonana CCMP1335]|eukprot:scaffold13839_cov193-Alexandrium_tamarense.AAC.3
MEDTFVHCLKKQLQALNLCSSEEEYRSIAEAIASQDVFEASESYLQLVTSSLLEYFEETVSELGAKEAIRKIAVNTWGDDVVDGLGSFGCDDDNNHDDSDDEEEEDEEEDIEPEGDDYFIGKGECELCERTIKLTRHHLIPKSTWPRMKKRLLNAAPTIEAMNAVRSNKSIDNDIQEETQQVLQLKLEKALGTAKMDLTNLPASITQATIRCYLSQVCNLCRQCHSAVHRIHSEWELATEFNTIDRLLECEDVRKFGMWANKQRPGKFAINK